MSIELGKINSLTYTLFCDDGNLSIFIHMDRSTKLITVTQFHSVYAATRTTHGTNFFLTDSESLTATAHKQELILSTGENRADQSVTVIKTSRLHTAGLCVSEFEGRCFLYNAVCGCHEEELILHKFLKAYGCRNLLVRADLEQTLDV